MQVANMKGISGNISNCWFLWTNHEQGQGMTMGMRWGCGWKWIEVSGKGRNTRWLIYRKEKVFIGEKETYSSRATTQPARCVAKVSILIILTKVSTISSGMKLKPIWTCALFVCSFYLRNTWWKKFNFVSD